MGKALFFDIDGTLVDFQGRIPDSTGRALRRVRENGHLTVICSGRSLCQLPPRLLEMGFDGIIAAAGAYVGYQGKVIYKHYMDKRSLTAACSILRQAGAAYSAQTSSRMLFEEEYMERINARFHSDGRERDESDPIIKCVQICESLEQNDDIEKLNFFGSHMPIAKMREELSDCCDVTAMSFDRAAESDGEISAKGINKALGIQKFIDYAGIAWEDTVAFGDGPNDNEMLEYVKTGVAMGNATEDLKKLADFVTTGIDEDGIEYAMKKLGLL